MCIVLQVTILQLVFKLVPSQQGCLVVTMYRGHSIHVFCCLIN